MLSTFVDSTVAVLPGLPLNSVMPAGRTSQRLEERSYKTRRIHQSMRIQQSRFCWHGADVSQYEVFSSKLSPVSPDPPQAFGFASL